MFLIDSNDECKLHFTLKHLFPSSSFFSTSYCYMKNFTIFRYNTIYVLIIIFFNTKLHLVSFKYDTVMLLILCTLCVLYVKWERNKWIRKKREKTTANHFLRDIKRVKKSEKTPTSTVTTTKYTQKEEKKQIYCVTSDATIEY